MMIFQTLTLGPWKIWAVVWCVINMCVCMRVQVCKYVREPAFVHHVLLWWNLRSGIFFLCFMLVCKLLILDSERVDRSDWQSSFTAGNIDHSSCHTRVYCIFVTCCSMTYDTHFNLCHTNTHSDKVLYF